MNPKMKASALFIAVLSPVPRSSILLLCGAFMSVWAQQETGSITGQVADASGAAVPKAQNCVVLVGNMHVAKRDEGGGVAVKRVDCRDGNLDIDHRLRGKA